MARQPEHYPQDRIAKAADFVGRGPETLPRQIELLSDPDGAVRYWAAVGLRALGEEAASAEAALAEALDDPSPCVRIEAAAAIAGIGRPERALPVLTAELGSERGDAVLQAARALELMGEQARPAIGELRAALQSPPAKAQPLGLFIRFSLETALSNLGQAPD
jgi:HEAT repeat protein